MNRDMSPPDLLRSAAKLIERALVQLDTTSAPCPHCRTTLFRNLDHGRVTEQLVNLPGKLIQLAGRIANSTEQGTPRSTSPGFSAAREKFLSNESPEPFGPRPSDAKENRHGKDNA